MSRGDFFIAARVANSNACETSPLLQTMPRQEPWNDNFTNASGLVTGNPPFNARISDTLQALNFERGVQAAGNQSKTASVRGRGKGCEEKDPIGSADRARETKLAPDVAHQQNMPRNRGRADTTATRKSEDANWAHVLQRSSFATARSKLYYG